MLSLLLVLFLNDSTWSNFMIFINAQAILISTYLLMTLWTHLYCNLKKTN